MATRGIIARETAGGGWEGRFHHFDSYPSGLGETLLDWYFGYFGRDGERLCRFLIDEHTAWRSIVNRDPSAGIDFGWATDDRPQCFCHGPEAEHADMWTQEHRAEMASIDYVYVFGPNRLRVFHPRKGPEFVLDLTRPRAELVGLLAAVDAAGEEQSPADPAVDPDPVAAAARQVEAALQARWPHVVASARVGDHRGVPAVVVTWQGSLTLHEEQEVTALAEGAIVASLRKIERGGVVRVVDRRTWLTPVTEPVPVWSVSARTPFREVPVYEWVIAVRLEDA